MATRSSRPQLLFLPVETILCLIALSLSCLMTPARAAEPATPMKLAIDRLVESQNLDKLWPVMMETSAKTGVDQVQRGAREAIDKIADLAPDQRAQAYAIIAETSAPMAAEINELHRKMPVKALVTEMALAVYTKYFTASEIEALARFYSSPTFQKLARIQVEVSEESARTGQRNDALQSKYMARLTPRETEAIMAFSKSAIGQKQRQVGPALAADMRKFMHRKTDADFDAVSAKYGKLMQMKLQKILQRQGT